MSFNNISTLLTSRPLRQALMAAQVVSTAQKVVGLESKVIMFKNGNLKLKVASSVAAAQIKATEVDLIKKLNTEFGRELVKKISYRVGE